MRLLRQIHAHTCTRLLPTSVASFALSKIHAFAALSPLGDATYARRLFSQMDNPNVFSWNSMIRASSRQPSSSKEPIFLFKKMLRTGRFIPNSYTIAFVLKACSVLAAAGEGRQVHKRALQCGFESNPFVQTSLVKLYARCDYICDARKMFDEIADKNVVAWSTMISGYAKTGLASEGLILFREMQVAGVEPDEVTMVSVISACAVAGTLELGKWVHTFLKKRKIEMDVELSTALVNMYAKCGCIDRAQEIFKAMNVKDAKAWSSMIMGFAIHGLADDALNTFSEMEDAMVKPNDVTFVGVLLACAHSGLVPAGRMYWSKMMDYGIEPSMELYGCMVDLLCRTGTLDEAYAFVETMHITPNPVIWRMLLGGCKKRGNLDPGESISRKLLSVEQNNAENYILLVALYASASQWDKVKLVRKDMQDRGIKPVPGCSYIEVGGFLHKFLMADWCHPDAHEIKEALKDISNRVSSAGHSPLTSFVLHNIGEQEKATALCEHSERLAIAYGLLKTKAPMIIRVVKNLRVCGDCHEVTKIISKVYSREIVVRDRVRFHKFSEGICSCNDFW
uniref:DYW domain-containing protein n=1 Tax=Kalanchoe fedtschenkoi TaxID=63787 RepID=A0A7N0TU85_KALFE